MDLNNTKTDKAKTKRIQSLISEETDYLQSTYKIKEFNKKELPFCIVVPSFQNVETGLYLRNLNSIFMQNYTNYHVVYIDDASGDDTQLSVKRYIAQNDIPADKIKIIVQENNRKPVYTIYNAINKYCRLGELALIVEGDDALIGTNVLKLYNAVYQKEKCAMIYSSYLDVIDNAQIELGVAHQIMDEYFQKNTIRTIEEMPGRYLLSFYVDIFKSIKDSDFKDERGYFMWYAYDRALITPLLEIAYPRIKIVKEILYEHRRTIDTQSPKDWKRQSNTILLKTPYKPLKFFPFIERNKYKYFFDAPIQKIIKNTDFTGYTILNNFAIEGVSKSMHIRAIKLTEIIHNIRMGGEIVIELTDYEKSKEQKYKRIQKLLAEDKKYYNEKYDIDYYRKEQLPFCIVTPSYNNVKSGLYLRNLDSIFMQDYNNYHVVYVDDCSPDKTGEYVKRYLEDRKIPEKFIQVIINKENKKAMYNLHMAIHKYCNSGEVVVIIDGDDSFIGRNVLALYNAVYQRDGAAMAYSNFLTIHNNDRTQLGFCHEIDKILFEQDRFRTTWDLPGTHLMSFYSDLFKKIKLADLTYENGTFFDYAYDRAILTPLLEMAYPRISVIKEITYEYRNDTGINDAPDEWIRVSHIILDKDPYQHLEAFPFIKQFTEPVEAGEKTMLKTSVEILINNTDLSGYERETNKKITGIAKEQHLHAIKLTDLVENIDFKGKVTADQNSDEDFEFKKARIEQLLKEDKDHLETKYNLSKYKEAELPFCVVVSSYTSLESGLYWRNLNSILMQDYKNFRVVYINDNFDDESEVFINKFLEDSEISNSQKIIKIVKNQQTRLDLANIYYAAHNECNLNEIMLVVGDNDALIGRNVLSILNALYQQSQALVGYSCYLKMSNSSTELGKCYDIDEFYFKTKTFRNRLQYEKYRLMSFYTYLFRRIKVKDLTYQHGSFFTHAIDKAIMIPLIEMSYPKVLVVKEITYEDRSTAQSRDLIQEGTQTNLILSKDPYQKLQDTEAKP